MGILTDIIAYGDHYGFGDLVGGSLIALLLIAILIIMIVVAILRWMLRVNTRVNLLEGINEKLATLIKIKELPPELPDNPLENIPVKPPPKGRLITSCPICKQGFTLPARAKGKMGTCPKCKTRFEIK